MNKLFAIFVFSFVPFFVYAFDANEFYLNNEDVIINFAIAFVVALVIFSPLIRLTGNAISIFLKLGYFKKALIAFIILSVLFIIYIIISYIAPWIIEGFIVPFFEARKGDFFVGIVAGLIVAYITGNYIQERFIEQRNDNKLQEVKMMLNNPNMEDCEKAIKMLERLDRDLHAESQYFLGTLYRDGEECVQENLEKARKLFEKAAKKGHKEARRALANINANAP